ncbi:SMP-30/gluconolactonase/LRE family protein [Nakamurella endophytica]|uniref:Gluconolactonase n=1 Tax=Nakamurella endophytica TaxID=1748367 RepID=A0A917SZ99_9ACTN|nr:SMP-30/gluconolactonase/LRE family protein [Nakamurella endophytica]GGM02447.1 gluconolactonase [Nakamurella endophytica]
MQAEQITDPLTYHGEGAVWSPSWGGLRFVDMLAGDVLTLQPDGTAQRLHAGRIAAVVRPRVGGGAVIGVEHGWTLEDPDGTLRPLPAVIHDPGIRMNEGDCDPQGRFYCGSMAYAQAEGAAALYRLHPDGTTDTVLRGVTVSNGLAWTSDGSLAFYDDTPTHRVAVFDHDPEGGLSNRRVFVTIDPDAGNPDGLTVDAEGGVWVALYGGGAVHHYTADGRLADVVELPASQVTSCTFGGDDLRDLFITTSRENLDDGDEPLAGAVFRTRPGVTGQPVRSFAG